MINYCAAGEQRYILFMGVGAALLYAAAPPTEAKKKLAQYNNNNGHTDVFRVPLPDVFSFLPPTTTTTTTRRRARVDSVGRWRRQCAADDGSLEA
jgi:hypothetical protein